MLRGEENVCSILVRRTSRFNYTALDRRLCIWLRLRLGFRLRLGLRFSFRLGLGRRRRSRSRRARGVAYAPFPEKGVRTRTPMYTMTGP